MSQDPMSPRLRQALEGVRRLPNFSPSPAFNANVLAAVALARRVTSPASMAMAWAGGASCVFVCLWAAGLVSWIAWRTDMTRVLNFVSMVAEPRTLVAAVAMHAAQAYLGLVKLTALLQTVGGAMWRAGSVWASGISFLAAQCAAALVLTGFSWLALTRNQSMEFVPNKRRSL